jgi:hypothetical protein
MVSSRRVRWTRYVAEKRDKSAYGLLVGRPRGKRILGRPRHSWVDNIKMDLGQRDRMGW